MSTEFYKEVEGFVSLEGVAAESAAPFISFPEKKLLLQMVPLRDYSSNPLQFQTLSEAYERKGWLLIHLWEDVWNSKRPIVRSRLSSLLGNFKRVHARQTVVRRIDKPAAGAFFEHNHLQGSPQVKHKYGLFLNDELVAAASFSAARPMVRHAATFHSYELVRFANLSGHVVTGGLSKLLAQFIADVQPDDIMSYADRDWSLGRSYEKLGFTFVENTPPQLFYIHPQEQVRYYLQRLPGGRHEDELLAKGYLRIYNAGNKKYLKLLKQV